ncbi:MAG: hypothetical protein KJO06_04390 [Gemmatimonadetes bacterium]|nr:hypothetical protein [Gemmatimonadota bacterium]NNK48958.1 hypothetical protein [Gemmatimonadota bacterium]
MTRHQAGLLVGFAVAGLVACSGNPMPGESGYPYNMTGVYTTSVEAMGTVYEGPAEIATSPGGLIYGTIRLDGPETVLGDMEGSVSGDTLTFESHYERAGGCTGVLSGTGLIEEGGGAATGDAVVDDDCAGDMFDAVFTMSRQTD